MFGLCAKSLSLVSLFQRPILATSAIFFTASAHPALAKCAEFVRPPLLFERSNWSELESFVASKSINGAIDQVQRVKEDGQGRLNIDQYSITIDAAGQSASALFNEIRGDLGEVIFGLASDLYPFSEADGRKWTSKDPTGSVMVFRLKTFGYGTIPLERGAVVVSCNSDTDLIFSTVKVGSAIWPDGPGWHPVSGNRAFGVRDNGNGSLTIFVKAADRVANVSFFAPFLVGNDTIFAGGHSVWLKMLDNIAARYKSRSPRDRAVFSERINY